MTSPWDRGITWRTERVSVESDFLALPLDYAAEKILRVKTAGWDDDRIEDLIRTATELCELETDGSVQPQTLRLICSGFPCEYFNLQTAPVRRVTSISYYDGDNVLQEYGGSPPSWILTPGGRVSKATVHAGVGETWPSTATRPDAVTVEFEAGFETAEEIPRLLLSGIGLCVAELYKNPDLSNDMGQIRNVLELSRFWPQRF